MNKHQTTASALREGLDQGLRLARGIQSYLDTGTESHLLKIPKKLNWNEGRLIVLAVQEAGQTPESAAVFTAVCCRIASNPPEKADELSERVCDASICTYRQSPTAAHHLVSLSRERGMPDFQLAMFVFLHLHCDPQMKFGWEEEKHETVFGAACDTQLFYEKLSSSKRNALEDLILSLPDDQLLEILQSYDRALVRHGDRIWSPGRLQGNIARDRSKLFRTFLDTLPAELPIADIIDWRYVITATNAFDEACADYNQRTPSSLESMRNLVYLDSRRDGKFASLAKEACLKEGSEETGTVLAYLANTAPEAMIPILADYKPDLEEYIPDFVLVHASRIAAEHWSEGGSAYFTKLLDHPIDPHGYHTPNGRYKGAVEGIITANPMPEAAHDWVMQLLEKNSKLKADLIGVLWEIIATHQPKVFEEDFWALLQHKSKSLRSIAREALASIKEDGTVDKAVALLSGKKVDTRLGGAELLELIADPTAAEPLKAAIESESSEKVRTALHAAFVASAGEDVSDSHPECSLEDLEADFEKQAKKLKIPAKATWFDPKALPTLKTTDGESLSDLALTFMVAKQSKHKTITLAPDIAPLAVHIDRESSDDFAMAILKQWLGSDQAAADRWALVFAGYFGNQRLLPELVAPIQSWAENSRHKLAEYAAQAIALVPGDEALMILDSLANRYRSRFKNIGKACRDALDDAANARGVSLDELADMIVPDLGFNDENERALPETEIRAVLQPDFKLTFYNPETEKETKSPPASLTDVAKDDLKTLRKLIRETVKGQTARLELSLVRERRWPTKRWSELFEDHPILQSFASRLVWRSLDSKGEPRRLFRRYPNGLLADAAGELIELDDADDSITMVHPLHLDTDTLVAWQAHLARMKVTSPFPQLERPVALLEADHGNRKTLATVSGKQLSVGTFRSRAEKRGWIRGSVVDAGGITAYHKSFHEAKVDVILHVEEMWIGQDAQDEMTLGEAYFVRGDSVKTGSYEYDEPSNQDDERILTFASVPAIVYSETVTDLQAIAP